MNASRAFNRGMKTGHTAKQEWFALFWKSAKAGAALIAALLISLLIWNTNALSEQIYDEYSQRDKAEQLIISCLRHGAAYFNNELHLCRPANVWIEKGKDLK